MSLLKSEYKSRPMNVQEIPASSFVPLIKPGVLSLLGRLAAFLEREGAPAYLVGGFVRDTLLSRKSDDIDIAIAGNALEIGPRAADYLGGRYVLLDPVNHIGRVILSDEGRTREIDFSSFSGGIEDDLAGRDFTIDALAIDLNELTTGRAGIAIIDPSGGLADLGRGALSAVSETAFRADSARLLRGVRLAAELGFEIVHSTEALIMKDAALSATVAGERTREELLRILALPGAGRHLSYLDRLGLLAALIPELAPARAPSSQRSTTGTSWNTPFGR